MIRSRSSPACLTRSAAGSTLRVYARLWNGHALPRLGHSHLRELSSQVIARFRAELEADGVGIQAILKTTTMLQGVLQRAVEWGLVSTNAAEQLRSGLEARFARGPTQALYERCRGWARNRAQNSSRSSSWRMRTRNARYAIDASARKRANAG